MSCLAGYLGGYIGGAEGKGGRAVGGGGECGRRGYGIGWMGWTGGEGREGEDRGLEIGM